MQDKVKHVTNEATPPVEGALKPNDSSASNQLICGLVMPISAIDGCSSEHWSEVKSIIQDAIESIQEPRFTSRLVSEADESGIIQKRIVQGVYGADVVVCDVSAKNANVMFELGMRLAFDKPTVIIKDDRTDYSFDTSVIEHLTYPRDLRFAKILAFKKQLADKVLATYLAAKNDPQHSTFLKSFGTFKVAQLQEKEASGEVFIVEMLTELQKEVVQLRRTVDRDRRPVAYMPKDAAYFPVDDDPITRVINALLQLKITNPEINLEPGLSLERAIAKSHHAAVLSLFSSREAFSEAVMKACDAIKML